MRLTKIKKAWLKQNKEGDTVGSKNQRQSKTTTYLEKAVLFGGVSRATLEREIAREEKRRSDNGGNDDVSGLSSADSAATSAAAAPPSPADDGGGSPNSLDWGFAILGRRELPQFLLLPHRRGLSLSLYIYRCMCLCLSVMLGFLFFLVIFSCLWLDEHRKERIFTVRF